MVISMETRIEQELATQFAAAMERAAVVVGVSTPRVEAVYQAMQKAEVDSVVLERCIRPRGAKCGITKRRGAVKWADG